MSNSKQKLISELLRFLPSNRVLTSELELEAASTDASFYRIKPLCIVDAQTPDEITEVFKLAVKSKVPVTFRAAGTSLSGQAQGSGILLRVSRHWKKIRTSLDGSRISLEPGVIGSQANLALKPFRKKIGPDPASIHACMIGGIAANNSSGMCCGTSQNSYQTLYSMKLIFPPRDSHSSASSLNTGDTESCERFRREHPEIMDGLSRLRERVIRNPELKALIESKYRIKNTMGYSLNALVDFEDPIDILSHLMIGSEGTLGFISEITYRTIQDDPYRCCALAFFPTTAEACRSAGNLRKIGLTSAELMDRASLRSIEDKPGMPTFLKELPSGAAALLLEVRGNSPEALAVLRKMLEELLLKENLLVPAQISTDPVVFEKWWDIRRGLLPSVGRSRPSGSTLIIEDIAFPLESLADATEELISLLHEHQYADAILFGHVMDGNLHFVFAQDFDSEKEVRRYGAFMESLASLVTDRWKGSLKAEHGTGRNMAPFLKREWGEDAFQIMQEIKRLFDPVGILNPGVILNENPDAHLESLKKTPPVDSVIDSCIECGFCEPQCPSRALTLTPRQRIAAFRRFPGHSQALSSYEVDATCATDGLCSMTCPVGIDTGTYVKKMRAKRVRPIPKWFAGVAARRFSILLALIRFGLTVYSWIPGSFLRGISHIPRLNFMPWVPLPARKLPPLKTSKPKVVYLPSCITRTLGPARFDSDQRSVPEATLSLLEKSGVEVLFPKNLSSLCCGLPFESKGFTEEAEYKLREVEAALRTASGDGKIRILSDNSPCSSRLVKLLPKDLKVYDSIEYIHDILKPELKASDTPLAVHASCSSRLQGTQGKLFALATRCSTQVKIPPDTGCCGFAGDKGFSNPELSDSALAPLYAETQGCIAGVSNSRTCEIGLSKNAQFPYQSLIHWIDRCHKPPSGE